MESSGRGSPPERPADRAGLSRRRFLGAIGAAGSAAGVSAVFGSLPASAAAPPSLAEERQMILQVASAGVAFPLRLPAAGDPGPEKAQKVIAHLRAAQRRLPAGALRLGEQAAATMSGVQAAEGRMAANRLTAARSGADSLIAAGLLGASQAALLAGLGKRAASAPAAERDALVAAVTLAVAAVFTGASAATADRAARDWLGFLRVMSQRGALQSALQQRSVR